MLNYKYINAFKIYEFDFEGAYCYYNNYKALILSKNGTSIIVSKKLLEELESKEISENFCLKLYQRGFGKLYDSPRYCEKHECIKPNLFMIDFTTKCNCNCIYCLRHFENSGESITEENLFKITDYIIKYCRENNIRTISFQPWGGEPLIEIDKIIKCKKRFEDSNINAKFNIQTNGILLTLKNYEKLVENNIDVGVSIDGISDVHDAHRLDIHGNSTHYKIVQNIRQILKKYPHAEIGTLSVNSNYSICKISQNINYIINELGISNIKFNLVHPSGGVDFNNKILIKKEDIPSYIDEILDGIIEQINRGNRCYEANITDKLLNILNKSNNNICNSSGCRGGLQFISFDQQGNIYPCEMIGREDMIIGNINDKNDLINLITEAKENNPYYRKRETDKCLACPFKYFCRGGCKACSLAYGNEACKIDEIECEINKYLYPKLIEMILENEKLIEKVIDNRYEIG